MLHQNVLGHEYKTWINLFILYACFLIILAIGCLCSPHWVTQEGEYDGQDYEWQGSLFEITEGDGLYEEEEYDDLRCFILFLGRNEEKKNFRKAQCDMFENLYASGQNYLFLELTAIFLIICFIASIYAVQRQKHCCIHCGMCTVITIPILHGIAFVQWAIYAKANFSGDCDKLYDGEDSADVCLSAGSGLSIAMLILIVIWSIMFITFVCSSWCQANRNKRHEQIQRNQQKKQKNESIQITDQQPGRSEQSEQLVQNQQHGNIEEEQAKQVDDNQHKDYKMNSAVKKSRNQIKRVQQESAEDRGNSSSRRRSHSEKRKNKAPKSQYYF